MQINEMKTDNTLPNLYVLYSGIPRNLTRRNISQIYLFLQDTLDVWEGFSIHRQDRKTEHTASVICQTVTATCC
jgi:hypothetical protein